ncbi:Golgin candidate 1 [Camellia lanceoleosa]|uniref:Golgin candidate 1 n=1 Tax=Camellia lanceoleosa TaxID=1840588 RepID=A0ACC0GXN0_9ERIC|nr:Golgin candidate 1 [Camellia lanceoleosa]
MRTANERTAKVAELEQKVALLEVECASLNQELQDTEARARRGQKKSPEDANQMIQAWQEEAERARQGQRDAERKLFSLEAMLYRVKMQLLLSLADTPPVHQPESDSAVIFLSASQSIVISVANDSGIEKIHIHGDASAKATLYRDRYLLLLHRLSRDQHFSKPAFDTKRSQFGSCEISPIQSLIGLTGGRWVMGVISQRVYIFPF